MWVLEDCMYVHEGMERLSSAHADEDSPSTTAELVMRDGPFLALRLRHACAHKVARGWPHRPRNVISPRTGGFSAAPSSRKN